MNSIFDKKAFAGAKIILFDLGNLQKNEKLCIIVDQHTSKLGKFFEQLCNEKGISSKTFLLADQKIHGSEPPPEVAAYMLNSNLVLGLTTFSMAHSEARKNSSKNKTRFLSLPDYSLDILNDQSLRANFNELSQNVLELSKKFSEGKKVIVTTKKGTNLSLDISGRKGNFAPGYVNNEILLGSPPDIEANVAPLENNSNGTIVVDASIPIPQIGKLNEDIILEIKDGKIVSMDGNLKQKSTLQSLFDDYGPKSLVLAELGIGFNNLAQICGNMLIDEGTFGTFHCGFGSNSTIGGLNKINFHVDFIFNCNQLMIDNEIIKF
jgi:2,5-dihydroxypyridine 5,6-dioxygenase